MDYRYTDEDALAVAITVTLREMDQLIAILGPIAEDREHTARGRAADLNRKLADLRKRAITSAIETLTYQASKFNE
jgi:hypothetical protein